jgi:NADH:ubiquinone oxidoreductase subunit F (NADH-binding)
LIYQTRILPALYRIQEQFGYLDRDELQRFSRDSGIPLYRLQAVASYFPHFRLTPPPAVRVQVCRDMACHLAGAGSVRQELGSLQSEGVVVEGVSCLGRCDRAPAVFIAVHQTPGAGKTAGHRSPEDGHREENEFYCLGRSRDDLKRFVGACLGGKVPAVGADRDAGRAYPSADWLIDPYKGRSRDYDAVKKVVAARDEQLRQAAEALRQHIQLPPEKAGQVLEAVRGLVGANNRAGGSAESAEWSDAVLRELDKAGANLRGMGGAGFSASQKWRDVRDAVALAQRRRTDPRAFVIANGDESEPGTFKDRELLLHFPHLVLEGVIVAGLATGATQGFIYIRHEYPDQIAACEAEIRQAEAKGMCGVNAPILGRSFPVSVFLSPGGYICGEQSALIEAMSDRRGEPRNLPPMLATNGLDDRPTLLSNVETFAWVPYILLNGGEQYASLGVNGRKGRRFFSVCGDVNRPGVYEVPMGLTLRELIYGEQYCQGIAGGRELKAIAPSGPSGGFLPPRLTAAAGLPRDHTTKKDWQELARRRGFDPAAQELDVLDFELELDLFRALSPTQMLGAGLVVYAEGRDMAEQAVNALEFYRNESCGKCVPCRVGSQKLTNLGTNLLAGRIEAATWSSSLLPLVKELSEVMNLSSICGLGRSVPMPLRTAVDFFAQDVARYLT